MTIKNAREKFLFHDLTDCSDRETLNQRTAKKWLNSYIIRFTPLIRGRAGCRCCDFLRVPTDGADPQ